MATKKTTTPRTKASDQPANVNLTYAQLKNEAAAPEPYTIQFPNGFVTFPDIFDMEVEEGARFLEEMRAKGSNDLEFLAEWLPEKEFKILKGARLKLRENALMMERVIAYYRDTMGTPGESDASASS